MQLAVAVRERNARAVPVPIGWIIPRPHRYYGGGVGEIHALHPKARFVDGAVALVHEHESLSRTRASDLRSLSIWRGVLRIAGQNKPIDIARFGTITPVHLEADGKTPRWRQRNFSPLPAGVNNALPGTNVDFMGIVVREKQPPANETHVGRARQIIGLVDTAQREIDPTSSQAPSVRHDAIVVVRGIELPANLELLRVAKAHSGLGLHLGPGQRRQQQRGENRDDRDNHEQLNERETLWNPATRSLGSKLTHKRKYPTL